MAPMRLFAAPLLVAAAAAKPLSFDDYCAAYGKHYSGEERDRRHALYDMRTAEHARLNARPGATWTAGPGPLTDLFPDEMQRFFGYVGRSDAAELGGAEFEPLAAKAKEELPQELDWRQRTPSVVPPVRMQGWCANCWATAAVATIESAVALATGKLPALSLQQLTSCTPNEQECGGYGGCSGNIARFAFNYTVQHGLASEEVHPYENGVTIFTMQCKRAVEYPPIAGIAGFVHLPMNDAQALLRAVVVHGPVSVSVDAHDWHLYEKGIFDGCNKTNPIINHVVALVGYGEEQGVKYWTLLNSWGKDSGEDGYVRLLRHGEADEPCGTNTDPQKGSWCKGGPSEVRVCGECGILADSAFPTGAFLSQDRRLSSGFLV